MHFHGVTQFRTPYMDGDEMVSNCPIQTGHSFTYEFVAHPVSVPSLVSRSSIDPGTFRPSPNPL